MDEEEIKKMNKNVNITPKKNYFSEKLYK